MITHSCTRDCSPESRRPPELLRKIIWQTYWEGKSCHGAALVVFTLVQSLKWCVYVRTYNICTSYRGLHMFVWKNAIKLLANKWINSLCHIITYVLIPISSNFSIYWLCLISVPQFHSSIHPAWLSSPRPEEFGLMFTALTLRPC